MMEKITRKEAHDSAMVHYFTGKPCIHGHVAPRLVLSGNCVECNRTMRPMRKSSKPLDGGIIAVKITIPKNHVAALKQIAAAFCALEGHGRPTPAPGAGAADATP